MKLGLAFAGLLIGAAPALAQYGPRPPAAIGPMAFLLNALGRLRADGYLAGSSCPRIAPSGNSLVWMFT